MPSPEEAHAYTKRMPVTGICLAVATAATYNGILLLMAQQVHHRKTIILLASQVKQESEQEG